MGSEYEHCFICDEPTGRAGEDSIYVGVSGIGPWCESCHADMVQEVEGDARAEERALAANAAPVPALLALAALAEYGEAVLAADDEGEDRARRIRAGGSNSATDLLELIEEREYRAELLQDAILAERDAERDGGA